MFSYRSKLSAVVAAGVAALALAACGSSSSSSSSSSSGTGGGSSAGSSSASVLGKPDVAKGTPVKFGMVDLLTNANVNFPELETSVQATEKYLNAYRGGLDGHPISIYICPTDGQPSTSAACANKIVAMHPVAVLGGADTAAAAALPIYQRAHLAYIGGANITPAEATAKNSVIFNDMSESDNSDLGTYATQVLKDKKIAIIPFGDNQAKYTATQFIVPAVTAGGGQYKIFTLPPSEADATSTVAAALGYKPDAIILEAPDSCVALLNALQSLGNTKPVLSIDTCSAPNVIQATGSATNGMYYFSAYQQYAGNTPDAKLARAIIGKFGSAKQVIDSPALQGMNTLMNLWTTFHSTPLSKLTSAYMLKTLRAGSNHTNFLSTPYTCNGKEIPALSSICNGKLYVEQIKNGQPTTIGSGYDAGAKILKLGSP